MHCQDFLAILCFVQDFVTEFIILIPRDRDSNHPRRTLGLGTTSPHSIKIFGDNIYARSGSSLKIFRSVKRRQFLMKFVNFFHYMMLCT